MGQFRSCLFKTRRSKFVVQVCLAGNLVYVVLISPRGPFCGVLICAYSLLLIKSSSFLPPLSPALLHHFRNPPSSFWAQAPLLRGPTGRSTRCSCSSLSSISRKPFKRRNGLLDPRSLFFQFRNDFCDAQVFLSLKKHVLGIADCPCVGLGLAYRKRHSSTRQVFVR